MQNFYHPGQARVNFKSEIKMRLPRLAVDSCRRFVQTRKLGSLVNGLASCELSDDQLSVQGMANDFATKELAPFMKEWDEKEIFPVDTLRKAASLGFAGITLREANVFLIF